MNSRNPRRRSRTRYPGIALLALAPLLVSCASTLPPQRTEPAFEESGGLRRVSDQVGLEVLTVPEGQRIMLVKSPDDIERVCAPRESDMGMSVSEGLQLSLPGAHGAQIGEQAGDQAVALGHPTALVQLARELLFRACELSLNLNADAVETRAIYERFLATLETIAPAVQPRPTEDDDED